MQALRALEARDWARFEAVLHPDVVHRTPGVPAPILGRAAFLHFTREAVRREPDVQFKLERLVQDADTVVVLGEWCFTAADGPVRQASVSVIEVRDGLIWRDEEYFGLAL